MKNGKRVTDYLDECTRLDTLKGDTEAWIAALAEGPYYQLYRACLDDGWTTAEMDAAYERRFGRTVKREKEQR